MADIPLTFDRKLIEKCQINAPRYTSYPTADNFTSNFNLSSQLEQLNKTFTQTELIQPISLYIHIPFCNTLCLFCGCNKIITNDRSKISTYIDYLEKEIKLYANLLKIRLNVIQLHFGGGSPSWLSIAELNRIMSIVNKYFNLDYALEIAMELDPRHTRDDFILNLKQNGFNRISLGVQDLDPKVQKAVNRIQPFELTTRILNYARSIGFKSSNVDLIYGLPLQTLAGFAKTIDAIIELKPERIALFNYAHIPSLFLPQTRISESDMPSASVKLDILQMSVDKLNTSGYVFLGMDHFALPNDELAKAYLDGTMQRNFQGYSTFGDTNMLSFGVSAIGFIGNSYYQNEKNLDEYYACVNKGDMPILRGVLLTDDDIVRRNIIQKIMCEASLDFNEVSKQFQLDFATYFTQELIDLQNSSSFN
jgi:oxygen-independent coproporphyrinogen III oxidase